MLVIVDNAGMRWKLGLAVGSAVVVSGLCSVMLVNGVAHGDWDLPGLNQQVQNLTEVSNNHEGRITNLENQANSPTGQPTPTPVIVTKVVTAPAPTATPSYMPAQATPIPVAKTVTKVQHERCFDTLNPPDYPEYDAVFISYSDGTGIMTLADGSPATGRACQIIGGTW